MKWFNTLSHNRWLEQETDRIFNFGKNAVVPTGFGWLGNKGQIKEEMGTHLWITARMLHVYSVAASMGRPGAYDLVDHGIKAMNGALRDKKYGGWYACVNDQGVVDASKQGYQHFFALLGAASAVTTGHPEARKLLDYTIEVIEKYFWSEEEQMCLESWDEAFSQTEDYRGGNANMHAVEAFLIVYDVTHDKKWLDRALRIASVIIHDVARNGDYRVNEHFDSQWNPIRDYNKDNPAHRFRAYGGTPGHWIEWGRLMLHLHAALEARFETPPAWLLEDAKGLFHATIRDAWAPDGADGFVYSVDWDGKPIVRERVRWPIVEAMGTAYALYTLTDDSQYEEWYQKWWDYCIKYLMDYENGSWWQELDADNKVTTKVWDGKQDIYHLLHCLVIPRLPLAPGLAPAVAAGLLDINAKQVMRMAAMHSGGKTIQLNAGHYQAKIVTVGAGLAELTHHGRHVVIPHKPEEIPMAHLGKVLIPWPNRVTNGCYSYNGKVFQLAVNDPVSQTAIHGLLAWRDWQINYQSATEASLTIFLPPSYGYPFALISEVIYRLDAASGLHVLIRTQNIGDESAPYGAGAHPYLTCNLQSIDSCVLTLPASEELPAGRDFSASCLLGETRLDHAVKTATTPAEWEVRLTSPTQNMSTFLRSTQPWLQIYTGEKLSRKGLAVEPMSCPPDAFNSGIALIHLAPKAIHQLHFSIGCD